MRAKSLVATVAFIASLNGAARAETTRVRIPIDQLPRQETPTMLAAREVVLPDGAREGGPPPKSWTVLADDAIVPLAYRRRVEGERYPAADVPVMHAREVGRGRVVYLALGHDERGWSVPTFGALLRGAIRWASRGSA